jgi:hypothetical protein
MIWRARDSWMPEKKERDSGVAAAILLTESKPELRILRIGSSP